MGCTSPHAYCIYTMLKTFVGRPSWVPVSNACPSWVQTSAWLIHTRTFSVSNESFVMILVVSELTKCIRYANKISKESKGLNE